jgi:hypothetical protein
VSEISRAVFLSYASQDAEAARRICEALRAAGVEVWFDQSELRGGDSWDQKIRRQTKECALFVPVISANTQARAEGYFRLEWHLAEQRSHLIARGRPFIVPVAIDQTNDAEALVPDAFLAVQWMRLPGGVPSSEFVAQVKRLLAAPQQSVVRKAEAEKQGVETRGGLPPEARRSSFSFLALGGLAILVAGGVAFCVLKPRRSPEEIAKLLSTAQSIAESAGVKSAAETRPAAAPPTEARQLVQRAQAIDGRSDKTSEMLGAADELYTRALTLDPTDAEAWAGAARLDAEIVFLHFDRSDERRQNAQKRAARAFALAPDSLAARRAQANVYAFADGSPAMLGEADRMYRALVLENPNDKSLLEEYGLVLREEHHYEEAAVLFEKCGRTGEAGWNYFLAGRFDEAKRIADHLVAKQRTANALILKMAVEELGFEDSAAAEAAVTQFTPAELLAEQPAMFAINAALWGRDPDKAIRLLKGYPQEFIFANGYGGPKRYLSGVAHERAGRPEAARAEWQVALQQVQERLKAKPNDPQMLGMEALLLACFGDAEGAGRVLGLYRSLSGIGLDSPFDNQEALILLRLGKKEEVLAKLSSELRARHNGYEALHGSVRFNPDFDPLRSDPRFAKLLRETLPRFAKPFDEAAAQ